MNFQAVKVFTGGFSSNEDGLLETSKVVREEGPMTACSTLQIDQSHWDELDFLIWYHLDLLDGEGHLLKYWFQLPKYGRGYEEHVSFIPILEKESMVITLDERDGESIDEEVKTTNMESQYHDFSKK